MGLTIAEAMLKENYQGTFYRSPYESESVGILQRFTNPVQKKTYSYRTLSHAENRQAIRNVAFNLKEKFDVGFGDRVMLVANNHRFWPAIFAGITAIGAIVCPPPPGLKKEMDAILKTADPTLIITREDNQRFESESTQTCSFKETVTWPGEESPTQTDMNKILVRKDKKIALLMPTSGTTGKPKLPILTDRNIYENIDNTLQLLSVDKNDVITSIAPFYHVMGLTTTALLPAIAGSTLNYIPPRFIKSSKQVFCDTETTMFLGVPEFYEIFLASIKKQFGSLYEHAPKLVGRLVKRFVLGTQHRSLISGSASLPPEICIAFNQKLDLHLINGMGATENSPVISAELDGVPGSIGEPLNNSATRVAEKNENGIGKLQIQGSSVFKGYFGQPELTKEAFKNGWYKTGDKVKMKGQKIIHKGRGATMIVFSNGENVYPEEVEGIMVNLNQHPYIEDFLIREGEVNEDTVVEIVVEVGTLKQFKKDLKHHLNGTTKEHLLIRELRKIEEALNTVGVQDPTQLNPEELLKIDPIKTVLRLTIKEAVKRERKQLAGHKYPKSIVLVKELPRTETHDLKRGRDLSDQTIAQLQPPSRS